MKMGEMLGGGARLVRERPKALAWWGLLSLVAVVAMSALVWPTMVDTLDFQRRAMAATAAGAPAPTPPAGFVGGMIVMQLLLGAAMVAIFAAAVRAVARGGDDRVGFLRLGRDELRLVGLVVLLWLVAMVAMFAFMIAAGLLTAALYAVVGPAAAALLLPLWLLLMLALLWAEIRISLAGAFTVLRGRITVRAAWRATRGRFWTLFGAYLAIGITYVAVNLLVTAILFPQLFGLYAALLTQADPQAVIAAQQALFAELFGARMIAAAVVGTVVNTVLVAWLFGAMATAAIALDTREVAA